MATATGRVPLLTLNNGVELPALGLGVFLSPPEETAAAVATAIADGYRLIDTAAAYRNERQVGDGIKRSGIDRGDLFVQTKVWVTDYGYDRALHAFDVSLRKLGLDYLDLWLLHWPVPPEFDTTIATYKAAESLLTEGRVRAIGVSNFKPAHLDQLIKRSDVVPAVNQIELHPFFTQLDQRQAHRRLGIVTQSWSPIGGAVARRAVASPETAKSLLEHPVILALATKYDKTPAQVVLRWHIEHGFSVIPKSVHANRIAENIDIFDFSLSRDEVASVDALDTGVRAGSDPERVNAGTFGFTIDEA